MRSRSLVVPLSPRPALVGALAVLVLVLGVLAPGVATAQETTTDAAPTSDAVSPSTPGAFVPVQAARLFDSRDGARVVDQGFARAPGPLAPGEVVGVPIAGRGGVPAVGAGTVVLNVTGTMLFGSTFMTVWPQGAPRPPTSTLSLAPSAPVSTTVVTKLGDGGAVSLANVSGISDATVDVVGWFPENSPLVSEVPTRLLDSRASGSPLGAGESRSVRVPAPAGSSVLLTLLATGATAPTAVTAAPSGAPIPAAPVVSLAPGESLPTTTMVGVGDDGTVTLTNRAGSVDLAVDMLAVVPPAVGRSLAPTRLADTRVGAPAGPFAPGASRTVDVLGRGGVPASGVSSVVLSVTGIDPAATGAVGVWGAGPPPTTSAVVVPAGATRSGFAVVPVSPDGTVQYAVAGSAMDVVVDAVGWLAGTPAAATTSPATTSPATPSAAGSPSAPTDPTASDEGLLWRADYATGLSQYRSTPWNNQGAAGPQVTTLPGSNRPAVAVTMPGGGQRSEIEPNFRSLRAGDDLYFGFSVTLAPGFPADTDDWQVITQWKNDGTGSPPVSVKVGRGQFLLDGGFARGAAFQVPMGAAVPGKTQQVVVHVVFADGGGSVDTWVDGRQTITGFRPPAGTLYSGLTSYVKTGIYRNTAIGTPGTLYFDDWRIATTFAGATPR